MGRRSIRLAENQADFEALVAPAWQFANDSASRVPLTDWYDTKTGGWIVRQDAGRPGDLEEVGRAVGYLTRITKID